MEEQSGENSADVEVGVVVVAMEQVKQTVTLIHDTKKGELCVQSYFMNVGPVSRLDDVGVEKEGDMGLDMEIKDSVLATNISLVSNLNTDELNTYSFSLQCQDFAEHRRTGRDQDDRRQGSVDLLGRPNFQSIGRTLWPCQHAAYTCS